MEKFPSGFREIDFPDLTDPEMPTVHPEKICRNIKINILNTFIIKNPEPLRRFAVLKNVPQTFYQFTKYGRFCIPKS